MKPTKVYLKAMESALDAEDQLLLCRAAAVGDHLRDIECFKSALRKFEFNATWAKQIGALYVMTAQRREAYRNFNHSYITILDAQGMLGAKIPQSIPAVSWLKLYHSREKAGSLELAKVWFQALQMEHRTASAKEIIDEFIEPLEDYSESTDLFRIVGSIVDVVKIKQEWRKWKEEVRAKKGKKASKSEKELTVNIVAEELLRMSEELSTRWLSAPLTISPQGTNESLKFSRDSCGIGFSWKDSYTSLEMIQYLTVCLAKWGELRTHLEREGTPHPYGALLRTPLHTLAAFAPEYVIRSLTELYPDLIKMVDNFGATAMHVAAAHGNKKALNVLFKSPDAKGLLTFKDAGGFSPLHLGCSNPFFRSQMTELVSKEFGMENPCAAFTVYEKFADDVTEDDEDDEISPGGGWSDAVYHGDSPECAFDVRSGTSLSHHELIGRYLHSSRPIVLRNVIPKKIRKALEKKTLLKNHGSLRVRKEEYVAAELYGGHLDGICTIEEWARNASGTFASIEVNKRHTLSSTLHWLPEKLVPSGEGYTTTDDSWPKLVIADKAARSNFVFRSAHIAHAVVHGVQHWTLSSPISSRSSRDQYRTDVAERNSLKCTLHSGDVLVLPALWGSAFWSVGESVAIARRFIWK